MKLLFAVSLRGVLFLSQFLFLTVAALIAPFVAQKWYSVGINAFEIFYMIASISGALISLAALVCFILIGNYDHTRVRKQFLIVNGIIFILALVNAFNSAMFAEAAYQKIGQNVLYRMPPYKPRVYLVGSIFSLGGALAAISNMLAWYKIKNYEFI